MKTFRHLVNIARVDDEGFQTPISTLAQESGYSRAYFYKLMEGDFAELPAEERLEAVATALGVSVSRVKSALRVSWDSSHA